MATKEQTARDRVGNASAALFDVESMLPHDSDERKAVYRMRIGLNTMKARLVTLATTTENVTVGDSSEPGGKHG
jgi:hypothetical protein